MTEQMKECETMYEEYAIDKPAATIPEQIYKIGISIKPGQATITSVITPFRVPLPMLSMICTDVAARVQISDVSGSVVRIRAIIPPSNQQCSAVLVLRVMETPATIRRFL